MDYLIDRTLHDLRVGKKPRQDLVDLEKILKELKQAYPQAHRTDFSKAREALAYIIERWEVGNAKQAYLIYEGIVGEENTEWKLSTFYREVARMKNQGLLKEVNEQLVLTEKMKRKNIAY